MFFKDNCVIVGLTGMSGAGKTTACNAFREAGFAVIDCDRAAREVVEKGRPALKEIVSAFSPEILNSDGTLNRRMLGNIIFSDSEKRQLLNGIIYPYISYTIISEICGFLSGGEKRILVDAPTLFESGTDSLCDLVVSVVADEKLCLSRIMFRDSLTDEQAKNRLSSQYPPDFYREKSAYCVENSGTQEQLREKILAIAAEIGETYEKK
ncbi:MAG: dephospho-CoA kinase [Ruminiclostridium sp.]